MRGARWSAAATVTAALAMSRSLGLGPVGAASAEQVGRSCVDDAVNAYLRSGELPARDLVCTRADDGGAP